MRVRIAALIIGILLLTQSQAPAVYYVAPYGNATNTGGADDPKTLAWAMSGAPSGATVWLIPGTYKGTFTSSAAGVTYRSVPGTRAKLDGALLLTGADITWQDVELYSSWPTPRNHDDGSQLYITGPRARVLNSYIHDLAEGVGLWKPATDAVLSGNLIYNNGFSGTNYSIYTQNQTGVKHIALNVVGPSMGGYTLHAYSTASADAVHGFDIDRNVFLHDKFLIGGTGAASGITLTNNLIYSNTLRLGYTGVNTDVTVLGNTIIAPSYALSFYRWRNATVRNNTFITTKGTFLVDRLDTTPHTYDWDKNTWLYGGTYTQPFGYPSFSSWQATGVDATSTYTRSLPSQNITTVWPNGPNRGIISIQNWTNAPTVTIDLASLSLTPGASYRLINAQNPAEWQTFVAGTPVSMLTGAWTVATPIGASVPLRAFDPRFLVFVVEPA